MGGALHPLMIAQLKFGLVNTLLKYLHLCRHSTRLIQAMGLAFLLSLGVSMAAPAIQAQNQSPDTQIICLGNGGMKTVTFAADGSAVEVTTQHGPQCLLCAALLALPPASQAHRGLQAMPLMRPLLGLSSPQAQRKFLMPLARAPPTSSRFL